MIPQPKQVEDYLNAIHHGKRINDEFGWTGEWSLSVKDILDLLIDISVASPSNTEEGEKQNEALKIIQHKLMDLIAYDRIPDAVCPDINDLIDIAHKALKNPEGQSPSKYKLNTLFPRFILHG